VSGWCSSGLASGRCSSGLVCAGLGSFGGAGISGDPGKRAGFGGASFTGGWATVPSSASASPVWRALMGAAAVKENRATVAARVKVVNFMLTISVRSR